MSVWLLRRAQAGTSEMAQLDTAGIKSSKIKINSSEK